MKPIFLASMEEAFAVRQHVVLTLNTEDRYYFPEQAIGPANLNYFLAAYFSAQGFRVAQFAPSLGGRELIAGGRHRGSPAGLNGLTDPVEVLNRLTSMMRDPSEKWLVLVLHGERLAPASGVQRPAAGPTHAEVLHTIALDDAIAAGASRLVLVTFSNAVQTDELIRHSRGFRVIPVGLPQEEERRQFIAFLENLSPDQKMGRRDNGLGVEEFVRLTSGMPLFAIEAAYRLAGSTDRPLAHERVRQDKAHAIRSLARDLLEVTEPQEGFECVGGMQSIKSYFARLLPHIRASRAGVPQAILLQGVPGCGKSHLVKALARELGWPLLEMRNVRNPYVGQSEMNLEHVIRVVEQLQPAILFFDEIDQSLGQRGTGASGDSGTSERILARLFTWLGSLHLRGKTLFVGATNRPDILDPALLDRFGISIPVLKPTRGELAELIALMLQRLGIHLADLIPAQAAEMLICLEPTGRCIQEILIDANIRAMAETGAAEVLIGRDHLEAAARNHISREDGSEMQFVSLVALSLASMQSLLPWNDEGGLRAGAQVPRWLLDLKVVDTDGRLNKPRLDKVLTTAKQQRFSTRMMR